MLEENLALARGGVPERSKGSDCKSDGLAFEGSNPSPSTKVKRAVGGCSSTVEPQPSKLMVWVRFPSPAPIALLARASESRDAAELSETEFAAPI